MAIDSGKSPLSLAHRICAWILVATGSGCQTVVELEYATPPAAGQFTAAEKQANDHFEYFVLPRSYVLVAPSEEAAGKNNAQGTANTQNTGGTGSASGTGSTGSKSDPGVKQKVDNKAAAAGNESASTAKASASGSTTSVITNPLANALIDGKSWVAKVVPMPDNEFAFAVRGVSGFWKSTTLGVSRYQNTDLVASVSSTAENLVPKRIGQIAGVAANIIGIATAFGVAGRTPDNGAPLEPFVIQVSGSNQSNTINSDWTYSFTFDDETPPSGTVTIAEFTEGVKDKKVAYWPTPACRSATLRLFRQSDSTRYAFHIVVSSPDSIRLQPLPASGKVELGTICSASASGTAAGDAMSNIADDLQAAQQAVKTIKDAINARSKAAGVAGTAGTGTK